jgi:hypothetical protein
MSAQKSEIQDLILQLIEAGASVSANIHNGQYTSVTVHANAACILNADGELRNRALIDLTRSSYECITSLHAVLRMVKMSEFEARLNRLVSQLSVDQINLITEACQKGLFPGACGRE